MIVNVILAILVLSVIIIVHEFGHFIVAKANGVTVLEFALGFGPKLIHFKKGETVYSIKLLPFGGSCMMLGDEFMEAQTDEDEDEQADEKDGKAKTLEEEYDADRAFSNKSVWSRIAIIAAGPLFNFLLALILSIIMIGVDGYDLCTVDKVYDNSPAQEAGLAEGDTILKIDGACVSSAADAVRQLSGGKSVRLLVQRGQKQAEFFLTPEKTQQGYRLGVSVRDNISGIGTITFYDPETGVCGALGHGVTGLSGTQPHAATGGILVPSVESGVKNGLRGTPGELHGSFDVSTALGSVSQNETHGIFGTLNASPAHEAVPVADSTQVRTGAATILANVDGAEVTEYSVRIDRLYPQAENGRNLLITVTDERLLEKTGGIVQGMSGSPILQDGRLVGAVTHVLVNRPEQGYGIFMQTMLSQCDAYR